MNLRSRLGSQHGATLLIIIGIAAALLVMTTTLVIVIGNMQANTADSRTRDKAAAVGEAAMDAQMYALATNWPVSATSSPLPTLDSAKLREQFLPSEFPNTTGDFVSAVYYDDFDTNGPTGPTSPPDGRVDINDAHWDANGNNRMYVEAQGKVNGRATRFQALVERTFVDTTFPHGVAVFSGGYWDTTGGAGVVDVQVSGGYSVYGRAVGLIDRQTNFVGVIADPGTKQTLEDMLPQSFRDEIVATAKSLPGGSNAGTRYYDCTSSNPLGADTVPADKSGLCVIKVPNSATPPVALGNEDINRPQQPGILFVLGGSNVAVTANGNMNFYGMLYTDGTVGATTPGQPANGTQQYYGMIVAASGFHSGGNNAVHYNDTLLSGLANKWTLAVRLVPNTWREIQPK